MAFVPRLTKSGMYNSPWWYSTGNIYYPNYQLPNCTCYCYGRWGELYGAFQNLPSANGGDWYRRATNFKRGNTPQLGAIACWYSPTGSYAGHVAVVEQITSNGIVTSNSGYFRPIASNPPDTTNYFWTETCMESNGYRSGWMISRGYQLAGFIYNDLEPVNPGDLPTEWVTGNRYLTEDEMKNNAYLFYIRMTEYGWTLNAVCGALGNIQSESGVNPGIWQNLYPDPANGYGLVQWTPSTNYTDWADSKGYEHDSGDAQCECIATYTETLGQWIPTGAPYNITWEEFYTSTQSPEHLASAFLRNFERPPNFDTEGTRRQQAREWWEYLSALDPNPDIQDTRSTLPLYMYLRLF